MFGLSRQRPVRPSQPAQTSTADARLTFALHEYDRVKDELLAAITSQHTTMTYGLTATAAIFTGLLTTWRQLDIRLSILGLAPIFLTFIWFIWFGELTRMARAARFLWVLEKRLNVELPAFRSGRPDMPALQFESWARGDNEWRRNLLLGSPYVISSSLLLGMAVVSSVLAVTLLLVEHPGQVWIGLLVFSAAAATLGAMVVGAVSILRSPILRRGNIE